MMSTRIENFARIEVYEYGIEGYGYFNQGVFGNLKKRNENNLLNSIKVKNPRRKGSSNNSIYIDFAKSLDPLIDAENGVYGELNFTEKKGELRNMYKMYKNIYSRLTTNQFSLFNQFYNLPKEEFIIATMKKAVRKQYNYMKKHLIQESNLNLRFDFMRTNNSETFDSYINLLHDGAFIYNINIEEGEKIILFGDFHGSFHTFLRHLFRLHILGVINLSDGKYKINDGYRIIFLGDLVDRGNFALEIIYILSRFIIENNTKDKLKLIINRGNHENFEAFQFQGFKTEYNYKLKNKNEYFLNNIQIGRDLFMCLFFIYLPSAIILQKNTLKYWCCHGGIPLYNPQFLVRMSGSNENENMQFLMNGIERPREEINLDRLEVLNINEIENNKIKFFSVNENNIPKQIRWNDFSNNLITQYNTNRGSTEFYNLGIRHVKEFLRINNIQMIIRGHQDRYFNTWLLSNSNIAKRNKLTLTGHNRLFEMIEDCVYNLSKIPVVESIRPIFHSFLYEGDLEINRFLHKEPLKSLPREVIMDGAIATVDANLNKWDNINFEKKFTNNDVFYPVLTISTNTDLGRPLTKDSFILLRFDGNPPERNNMIINSKFNRNSFIYNIRNILLYNYSNKNYNQYLENNLNNESKENEEENLSTQRGNIESQLVGSVRPQLKQVPIRILRSTNNLPENIYNRSVFKPIIENERNRLERLRLNEEQKQKINEEQRRVNKEQRRSKKKEGEKKQPGFMKNTASSRSRKK